MSRVGPTKFYGAEPAEDGTTVRLPDGREFLDVNEIIDEASIEQIRLGYKCLMCKEPTGDAGAFPEVCPSTLPDGVTLWCNYPMREKQMKDFAIMYKGEVDVGSKVNLSDELERMKEIAEYESRTGIILPDHIKNSNEIIPS